MSWLRIDDKFGQHPKVLALTDREFRVHVLALCYCAEYGTDGEVPNTYLTTNRVRVSTRERLVHLGLWEQENGNYKIHDFRHYNPKDPTSAARKERWRERHGNDDGTDEEREGNGAGTFLTRVQPVPSPTQTTEPEGSSVSNKSQSQEPSTTPRARETLTTLDFGAALPFRPAGPHD